VLVATACAQWPRPGVSVRDVEEDLVSHVSDGPVRQLALVMARALGDEEGGIAPQRFVSVGAANACADGASRPSKGVLELLQSAVLGQAMASDEDRVVTAERWRAGCLYRSLEKRSLGSLEREAIEQALRAALLPESTVRAIPMAAHSDWKEPKPADTISREDFESNSVCVAVSAGFAA
jgi:hypothetical protein